MKTMLMLLPLLAVCLLLGGDAKGAYFDTIVKDPLHPPLAAEVLYTSKFNFDGGDVAAALVWHQADPKESWIPKRLLDAGVKPVTWTLAECGVGGNKLTAYLACGPGVNLSGTVLGPLTEILNDAGGNYKTAASLLQSPDGKGGLRLTIKWKTNILENGGFPGWNHLRFPPRYGVGYSWLFGPAATPAQ